MTFGRPHKEMLLAAAMILGAALGAFSAEPARTQLHGHVLNVQSRLAPIGRLPSTNRLDLAIGLPLRRPDELQSLLHQLYDPASTNFHRYLTPEQFTAGFGPTKQDYEAVAQFAQSNGLIVTHRHGNRVLLDVSGKVSDIEKAFQVTLRTYRHPTESRNFFAPDTEPSVSKGLAVLDISGLTDFGRPTPMLHSRPFKAGVQHADGSGPGSSYIGADFRNAYAPGTSLDGSGQMVGLFQLSGYDPNDIFAYEAAAGLPHVRLQNVLIDGANNQPDSGEDETCLDIEMAISMATNLQAVVVFEAPGFIGYWNDVLNNMAASNQVKQLSSSWGFSGNPSQTTDQIFQQMAAQGQSFFQASGDGDAWTNPIWQPAESPYITVVGGTTLATTNPGPGYASERVWNWGFIGSPWTPNGNGYWGSGGGVSSNYAIPDWQTNVDMTANLGSTNMRNIPDVALTADNVWLSYGSGQTTIAGGTSCAAPLWASFMALVNQQAAGMAAPAPGFINPAIYALGASSNYTNCFNDITNGDNTWSGSTNMYFAVPGYDLCTGWGTPRGTNLANVLAGAPDVLAVLPFTGYVAIGAQGGPFNGGTQMFQLENNGVAPVDWSLVNTSAWLTASCAGGLIAGGQQTNVSLSLSPAANALPAGSYPVTLIFSNQDTLVAEPRTFTLQVGQSLVQDGGFESGTFSYWSLQGNTIQGTTIFNAVETPAANFFVAHSGNFGAFLGDTNIALLSQSLPTCPGQLYLLSFWVNDLANGSGQTFLVNWITNSVTNTIFSLSEPSPFSWTNLNFTLSAADTNTIVQFGAANPPGYFGLDDVSVTPIAAPAFISAIPVTNGVALTWSSLANVSYLVQYTGNLSQPNWQNLADPVTASDISCTLVDTNAVTDPGPRFYRVSIWYP